MFISVIMYIYTYIYKPFSQNIYMYINIIIITQNLTGEESLMSNEKKQLRANISKEILREIHMLSFDYEYTNNVVCEKLLKIGLNHLDEFE